MVGVGLLAMFDIFTTLEVYWVMWIASEWTVLRETIVQMQDEVGSIVGGIAKSNLPHRLFRLARQAAAMHLSIHQTYPSLK